MTRGVRCLNRLRLDEPMVAGAPCPPGHRQDGGPLGSCTHDRGPALQCMAPTHGCGPNSFRPPFSCCRIVGAPGARPASGGWSLAGVGTTPPGNDEPRASSASTSWMSSLPADVSSGSTASPSACRSRMRSDTGKVDQRLKDLKTLTEDVRPRVVSSGWEQSALEFKVGALFTCRAGRLLNLE